MASLKEYFTAARKSVYASSAYITHFGSRAAAPQLRQPYNNNTN